MKTILIFIVVLILLIAFLIKLKHPISLLKGGIKTSYKGNENTTIFLIDFLTDLYRMCTEDSDRFNGKNIMNAVIRIETKILKHMNSLQKNNNTYNKDQSYNSILFSSLKEMGARDEFIEVFNSRRDQRKINTLISNVDGTIVNRFASYVAISITTFLKIFSISSSFRPYCVYSFIEASIYLYMDRGWVLFPLHEEKDRIFAGTYNVALLTYIYDEYTKEIFPSTFVLRMFKTAYRNEVNPRKWTSDVYLYHSNMEQVKNAGRVLKSIISVLKDNKGFLTPIISSADLPVREDFDEASMMLTVWTLSPMLKQINFSTFDSAETYHRYLKTLTDLAKDLHKNSFLYGDWKINNFMLDNDGNFKMVDIDAVDVRDALSNGKFVSTHITMLKPNIYVRTEVPYELEAYAAIDNSLIIQEGLAVLSGCFQSLYDPGQAAKNYFECNGPDIYLPIPDDEFNMKIIKVVNDLFDDMKINPNCYRDVYQGQIDLKKLNNFRDSNIDEIVEALTEYFKRLVDDNPRRHRMKRSVHNSTTPPPTKKDNKD